MVVLISLQALYKGTLHTPSNGILDAGPMGGASLKSVLWQLIHRLNYQ